MGFICYPTTRPLTEAGVGRVTEATLVCHRLSMKRGAVVKADHTIDMRSGRVMHLRGLGARSGCTIRGTGYTVVTLSREGDSELEER